MTHTISAEPIGGLPVNGRNISRLSMLSAGVLPAFGRRLQFRWDVFNVTNHPSYGLPNANLGSADFGTIRTTVSSPRQMQFGLRFLF